ncbi:MAG: inverse autotransporter beta domain-containing protein, partial [Candidatus Adiutrix sp.]|nr:inverse autotransporter beta domain-containing protein [Candidatus Adiutrix sp.]
AVKGAFERWKGDQVGAFGRDDHLHRDPKVWVAGLEWTPVPILSVSADQRYSGGRSETQIGLTFNYNFDMPWEDQLSSATVAEMRTVPGSRHDFVDRQYDMILEYQAKEGAYNIIYQGLGGTNIHLFRIADYFGKPAVSRAVAVALSGGALVALTGAASGVLTTDDSGLIRLEVDPNGQTGTTTATLTAGKTTKEFTLGLTGGPPASPHLIFTPSNGPTFTTPGASGYQSTASVKVEFIDDKGVTRAITEAVTWTVKSISNPSPAWWRRGATALNGLTWGDTADGGSCWGVATVDGATCTGITGDGHGVEGAVPTVAEIQLTDVVGSRSVILEASVTIDGVVYTGEETISFGAGPLSVFSSAPALGHKWARSAGTPWTTAYGDFTTLIASSATDFPAAAGVCGGSVMNDQITVTNLGGTPPSYNASFDTSSGGWRVGDVYSDEYYSTTSNLPTLGQLVAVSRYNSSFNPGELRKGAALAAGWPDDANGSGYYIYWTGQVYFGPGSGHFYARGVYLASGSDLYNVIDDYPVAVCAAP